MIHPKLSFKTRNKRLDLLIHKRHYCDRFLTQYSPLFFSNLDEHSGSWSIAFDTVVKFSDYLTDPRQEWTRFLWNCRLIIIIIMTIILAFDKALYHVVKEFPVYCKEYCLWVKLYSCAQQCPIHSRGFSRPIIILGGKNYYPWKANNNRLLTVVQ